MSTYCSYSSALKHFVVFHFENSLYLQNIFGHHFTQFWKRQLPPACRDFFFSEEFLSYYLPFSTEAGSRQPVLLKYYWPISGQLHFLLIIYKYSLLFHLNVAYLFFLENRISFQTWIYWEILQIRNIDSC